jgi:hypothetical protein
MVSAKRDTSIQNELEASTLSAGLTWDQQTAQRLTLCMIARC